MKRATGDRSYSGAKLVISIHALVKRATQYKFPMTEYKEISIHALVKRATNCFYVYLAIFGISIHALVKRATI